VETELNLGDRSKRFRVERDPALCGLLNGDVGHLCSELNLGTNLVSLVLAYYNLLIVLA
jgi:hypothetical protein